MAVQSDPGSGPTQPHATWLILARDGPALGVAEVAPTSARVRAVDDPSAFVELLTEHQPRIAILAEPPASETALRLVSRERRRRTGLRTIHLSAAGDVGARLAALRDGFDEALPQTIGPGELAARATILEERAREAPSAAVQLGNGYELDVVAHALRREGLPIHLRPKEFALLAMLAAHPGRAYTRRQLLDRVWGSEQSSDPRTVDVHVRWLRAKIEPQPDRPVRLITVRGVGYRLDPPLTEP